MFRSLKEACAAATAITGMTPGVVDWALRYAGRPKTALDRDFPFGYTDEPPPEAELRTAAEFWARQGIREETGEFIVSFFGTLGRQFELDAVIEAARSLGDHPGRFRFVLCGDGDRLGHYKERAAGCPNVLFPGWVGRPEIWTLLRLSSVGLAPYRSTEDFRLSLPNKSIEYLSAGLPIVTSLKGALENLVTAHDCGVVYENGSAESLAEALTQLQRFPEAVVRMRENATALFAGRFRAEAVYGEMADYLEQIAADA